MKCENGVLMLDDGMRQILEADIGRPLTSDAIGDVIADLEQAALRREAQGNPVWASMIRRTVDLIATLHESSPTAH